MIRVIIMPIKLEKKNAPKNQYDKNHSFAHELQKNYVQSFQNYLTNEKDDTIL